MSKNFNELKSFKDREQAVFTGDINGKTAKRVIVSIDGATAENALEILKQDVTTTPTTVVFPESTSVQIFHQTENAIVYFGDENVDNTYPKMIANSTLEINGRNDFTLWVVADAGAVPLFVMTGIKE